MAKRMLPTIRYSYNKSGNGIDINLNLNLSRFDRQYQKAQFALDSMVMTSMVPYMPMISANFINVTKAMSASVAGSGLVYAAAPPMGRFLYEGKVMVDPLTGSPWARPGAKKIVTNKSLNYSTSAHPRATDHWFDVAKKNHGASWIRAVKKIAGGG